MKTKIMIAVGVYLVAGAATAALLPSARGLALVGKLEAVALWPLWLVTYATGRAGDPRLASAGQSPPGVTINNIDNGRPLIPTSLRDVVYEGVRQRV